MYNYDIIKICLVSCIVLLSQLPFLQLPTAEGTKEFKLTVLLLALEHGQETVLNSRSDSLIVFFLFPHNYFNFHNGVDSQ